MCADEDTRVDRPMSLASPLLCPISLPFEGAGLPSKYQWGPTPQRGEYGFKNMLVGLHVEGFSGEDVYHFG